MRCFNCDSQFAKLRTLYKTNTFMCSLSFVMREKTNKQVSVWSTKSNSTSSLEIQCILKHKSGDFMEATFKESFNLSLQNCTLHTKGQYIQFIYIDKMDRQLYIFLNVPSKTLINIDDKIF